jgi:hypothetical protein
MRPSPKFYCEVGRGVSRRDYRGWEFLWGCCGRAKAKATATANAEDAKNAEVRRGFVGERFERLR